MVPTCRKVSESWLRKTTLRKIFYFAVGGKVEIKSKTERFIIMHLENEVATGNKWTWGVFETRRETPCLWASVTCVGQLAELSFRIGFNDKEILSLSAPEHSAVTCVTAFKRCAKSLFRRKLHTGSEEEAACEQAAAAGRGLMQGYRWLHLLRRAASRQKTIDQVMWCWKCGAQARVASEVMTSPQQGSQWAVDSYGLVR